MDDNKPFYPTGYVGFDILTGQNIRDLEGNLKDIQRGFQVSKQYLFSGERGTGKTTLIQDLTCFPVHIGYPLHKIIVFNTDNADYSIHRLQKVTGLDEADIRNKYTIYDVDLVQDIRDLLTKESAEYKALKLKPQEYTDIYTGQKRKMIPAVIVIIDTVTAIRSEDNDVDSKKGDIIGKQNTWVEFNAVSKLVNAIFNFFDRNIVVVWASHLKENKPEGNAKQPKKEYKSAPANMKANVPQKMRDRVDFTLNMYANDSANLESDKHPINRFALEDIESKAVYSTSCIAVKSRFGCEGRTRIEFLFMNGKFDRDMSFLATCYSLGVINETTGQYPNAEYPYLFREYDPESYEYETLMSSGRRRKKLLTLKDYNRPTNIIEMRSLLNYTGTSPEIMEASNNMRIALNQGLEDRLYYELETNNVTTDDIVTNKKQIQSMLAAYKHINRRQVMTKSDLASMQTNTPEALTDDDIEKELAE